MVTPYTITDLYNFYLSDKEKDSSYYVSKKEYTAILTDYILHIDNEILEGSIFYIPYGMGSNYVMRKKVDSSDIKKLSPDWALTRKYGKKIYHLNEHTNGYKYLFKWDKQPCVYKNHKMYKLTMVRNMKRTLAKYIKELGYNYIEE